MKPLPPGRARRAARKLSAKQVGIVTRRQLYAEGVPRWLVRLEIRVGRWQRTGRQTLATHNGPLDVAARRWIAVLEAGPRAALAGVTALQQAGIAALGDELIHVIVPKGARRVRVRGVRIHESRRWRSEDIVRDGIPRTSAAVAAVHAALWAVTDRQAMLFLTLAVQQRKATPLELHDSLALVRRHPRRRLLLLLVQDLADGVRSLNELDVGRSMRGRGLPEPKRQAIRKRPSGVQYLDADFPDYDVTLEIDGSQHDEAEARLSDLLRDIAVATDGGTTVRIPLVAWRLDEEAVLDAIEALFASRGWRRPAA